MNYQVIKLVSGEEIICDVIEASESSLKIDQPMVFKTTTLIDPTGNPYDITMLKDWLLRSDSKTTEVAKNHISSTIIPNESTIDLYQLEKERLVKENNKIMTGEELNEKLTNDLQNSFDEILDSFMSSMNNSKPDKRKKKKRKSYPKDTPTVNSDLESLIPDELKERPMIYLSMIIPPEAIMNMVTSGIIDPDQLLAMIDEVKKKNNFTGDEKKRKDFGNKLSDWNPDPSSEDY
jgi:hypothetical protein